MSTITVHGHPRHDGRIGARHHVLVLPSVGCASLVAAEIAAAGGGVAIDHHHGCGHIGDDVERSETTFVALAANPNVFATLVVSLGCETLQGARMAATMGEQGRRVALVRIQDAGHDATVEAGTEIVRAWVAERSDERREGSVSSMVLGVAASRASPLAGELALLARQDGVAVLVDDGQGGPDGPAETTGGTLVTALAAAGAHVVVSFPHPDQPPTGLPLCPVINIAGDSRLHRALSGDFDADEADLSAAALYERVLDVFAGRQTVAEADGLDEVVLPRHWRTM